MLLDVWIPCEQPVIRNPQNPHTNEFGPARKQRDRERERERRGGRERGQRRERERERDRVRPNERRRAGRETTIDKEGEQHRHTET